MPKAFSANFLSKGTVLRRSSDHHWTGGKCPPGKPLASFCLIPLTLMMKRPGHNNLHGYKAIWKNLIRHFVPCLPINLASDETSLECRSPAWPRKDKLPQLAQKKQ